LPLEAEQNWWNKTIARVRGLSKLIIYCPMKDVYVMVHT